MNANSNAHQHVLRSFDYLAVEFQQVRALDGLEAEASNAPLTTCYPLRGDGEHVLVVVEVSVVDYRRIK